jgi:hypothetical protein
MPEHSMLQGECKNFFSFFLSSAWLWPSLQDSGKLPWLQVS